MNFVVFDQATIDTLRSFPGHVQVRDAAGNVVGVFRPNSVHVYKYGEMPDTPEEELVRRENSPHKLSTAEVLQRLENL